MFQICKSKLENPQTSNVTRRPLQVYLQGPPLAIQNLVIISARLYSFHPSRWPQRSQNNMNSRSIVILHLGHT